MLGDISSSSATRKGIQRFASQLWKEVWRVSGIVEELLDRRKFGRLDCVLVDDEHQWLLALGTLGPLPLFGSFVNRLLRDPGLPISAINYE